MKQLKFILAAAIVSSGIFFLESCAKDENILLPEDRISFMPSVLNDKTKATDLFFETGDKIGVFSSRIGNDVVYPFLQNAEFTYQLDAFSGDYWYEKGTDSYDFFAYYPFHNGVSLDENGRMEYVIDTAQDTPAGYGKSDLMLAHLSGYKNDGVDPCLVFSHVMASVHIRITGLPYDMANSLLVKDVILSCSFSSENMDVELNEENRGDVKACFMENDETGTLSYSCYLLPQSLHEGDLLFEFEQNGHIYVYRLSADLELLSGRRYTFDLNLK